MMDLRVTRFQITRDNLSSRLVRERPLRRMQSDARESVWTKTGEWAGTRSKAQNIVSSSFRLM